MATIRAVIKVLLFALSALSAVIMQIPILLITKGRASYILPFFFHKAVCFIFGIRCDVVGTPNKGHQTLYMSNHLSYLDIPLIGGIVAHAFVAKSEVEGWALFGTLSKLQQTAFIQRKASEARRISAQLQKRIAAGESLIIFPEGTSTSGYDVIPFKSSLFALAMGDGATHMYVQPMTIQVVSIDARAPQNKEEQDVYAWPLEMEMELHEHLWRFAKTKGARIQLTFHEPLRASEFENRKTLAKACHDNVSKGLQEKIAA